MPFAEVKSALAAVTVDGTAIGEITVGDNAGFYPGAEAALYWSVPAELDLATVTTNNDAVLSMLSGGAFGNSKVITAIGDAIAAAGSVELVGVNSYIFHFQSGVSTVADFKALALGTGAVTAEGTGTDGNTLSAQSIDCAPLTTHMASVLVARKEGVSLSMVGDSAPGAGCVVDETTLAYVLHYEENVSTVLDAETALNASTLIYVATAGNPVLVLGLPYLDLTTHTTNMTSVIGGQSGLLVPVDSTFTLAFKGDVNAVGVVVSNIATDYLVTYQHGVSTVDDVEQALVAEGTFDINTHGTLTNRLLNSELDFNGLGKTLDTMICGQPAAGVTSGYRFRLVATDAADLETITSAGNDYTFWFNSDGSTALSVFETQIGLGAKFDVSRAAANGALLMSKSSLDTGLLGLLGSDVTIVGSNGKFIDETYHWTFVGDDAAKAGSVTVPVAKSYVIHFQPGVSDTDDIAALINGIATSPFIGDSPGGPVVVDLATRDLGATATGAKIDTVLEGFPGQACGAETSVSFVADGTDTAGMGSITCAMGAVNNDTFTMTDGKNGPVTFEYMDVALGFVPAADYAIDITAAATPEDVAAATKTAIEAAATAGDLQVSVDDANTPALDILSKFTGTTSNQPITLDAALQAAGFLKTNLVGGLGAGGTLVEALGGAWVYHFTYDHTTHIWGSSGTPSSDFDALVVSEAPYRFRIRTANTITPVTNLNLGCEFALAAFSATDEFNMVAMSGTDEVDYTAFGATDEFTAEAFSDTDEFPDTSFSAGDNFFEESLAGGDGNSKRVRIVEVNAGGKMKLRVLRDVAGRDAYGNYVLPSPNLGFSDLTDFTVAKASAIAMPAQAVPVEWQFVKAPQG